MMKSIIFALCVLGVAQATYIPSQNLNELESARNVLEETKEYLQASKIVGEYIDILKHFDLEENFDGKIENLSEVAKEMRDLIVELVTDENLWGQLETSAAKQLFKLLSKLLHRFSDEKSNSIMKRDVDGGKTELDEDEIQVIDEVIDDMDTNGPTKGKIEKLHDILSKLENGSEKMKNAIESDSVKDLWRSICELARGKKKNIPATKSPLSGIEGAKKKKSLGHKMCSEKTYAKMQNIMTKGHALFKKIREIFSEENINAVKNGFKKMKDLWNKIG